MKLFPRARGLAGFDLKLFDGKNPIVVRPLYKETVMPLNENKQKHILGIRQRENILPVSPFPDENPAKIGFAQQNIITPEYFAYEFDIDSTNPNYKFRDRHVRIFVKDDNHMHQSIL